MQIAISSRIVSAGRRGLAGLGLTLAFTGLAQTNLSPDRVTFYTEPNFRGEALTIEAGASLETLDRVQRSDQRPWTHGISSVRVDGAARAVVYTSPGFRGESVEIASSITDLYALQRPSGGTWDRAIASINVTGPRVTVIQAPPPRQEVPPPTVVVVPTPVRPPPPPPPRYSPREAEALVQRAYREVLDRPADPSGLRRYRDHLLREGWSERQLISELQRSNEARSINPEQAIARMYREILGREPDANGLSHYRSKWREGWTQGQIRDDLRRSHEGREAATTAAINRAYRDILGRDPDPEGLANYQRLMRREGYSERNIREALMSSDEYRQRKGRR
jgi:hypothetical protein